MKYLKRNLPLLEEKLTAVDYVTVIIPTQLESHKIDVESVQVVEDVHEINHYPLSFKEVLDIAQGNIEKMAKEERIDLAVSAFGMWKDDVEEWKDLLSMAAVKIIDIKTTNAQYAVFS
jgi:hypothetical protein